MHEIHVTVFFDADAESVFDAVSDHERFFAGDGVTCRLTAAGAGDRNGVGAVREITVRGSVFTEEITEHERPRRLAYVVRSLDDRVGLGRRFRHERGWLDFEPDGDRTRVDWRSRFEIAVPLVGVVLERAAGRLSARAFERFLVRAKDRLAVSR